MFVLDNPPVLQCTTQTVTRTVTALIFVKPTTSCPPEDQSDFSETPPPPPPKKSSSPPKPTSPPSPPEPSSSNDPSTKPGKIIQYSGSAVPGNWREIMLQQVNEIRAQAKVPPLKLNDGLNKAAQGQSEYQASINTMTHNNPAGGLGERVAKFGVTGWRGLAENVAAQPKDVTSTVNLWKNSHGHYANIVGDYTDVGFGVSNYYWTQEFAKFS